MRSFFFYAYNNLKFSEIPDNMMSEFEEKRKELIERLAEVKLK